MKVDAGWIDAGYEDDNDPDYQFRVPWHWRLRVWILNDLARLRPKAK